MTTGNIANANESFLCQQFRLGYFSIICAHKHPSAINISENSYYSGINPKFFSKQHNPRLLLFVSLG